MPVCVFVCFRNLLGYLKPADPGGSVCVCVCVCLSDPGGSGKSGRGRQ